MIESPSAVRWYAQRVGQTPHRGVDPGEVSSFTDLLVDGCGEEDREEEMQKAPSSENLTPGAISLMADSGATGFARFCVQNPSFAPAPILVETP